jgi:hypothetical protein
MKLLIVTIVEEFQKDILKLFRKAEIESFSSSEIDGYKNQNPLMVTSSWFPGEKGGTESNLFFSFTDDEKIDALFPLIEAYNQKLESPNPVKAIVVPIERSI